MRRQDAKIGQSVILCLAEYRRLSPKGIASINKDKDAFFPGIIEIVYSDFCSIRLKDGSLASYSYWLLALN